MTREQKDAIVNNWIVWMDENNFNANQFSERFEIPTNYLSLLKNGKYEVPTGNGNTVIADSYFRRIAEAISFDLGNKINWKFRETNQSLQIFAVLEDAKEYGYTNIIIGKTGSGKSYTTDLFVRQNPKDNYKITVGSMDTIADLLDKICDELKIPQNHSKSKKINTIIKELQRLRLNGRKPILIFDEAEYMKQATLANMKELHDHLNKKCGLVLIGTDQLEVKLRKLKTKNAPGMPQFFRRVKYGIRVLNDVDTRFKEFLNEISDKGLVKFLQKECDNYGELHDVLLPAMREAERLNEPLTEDLVRKMLNMPKN